MGELSDLRRGKPAQIADFIPDKNISPLPLGLAIIAAYLGLWGVFLALLVILAVADVFASPGPLGFETLFLAFGGMPVLHVLAACMLAASYGLFLRRFWAARFAEMVSAGGSGVILLLLYAGAVDAAETISVGINALLLFLSFLYVRRPAVQAYLRGHEQDLAREDEAQPQFGSWDEDSNGEWLGWVFLALLVVAIGLARAFLF